MSDRKPGPAAAGPTRRVIPAREGTWQPVQAPASASCAVIVSVAVLAAAGCSSGGPAAAPAGAHVATVPLAGHGRGAELDVLGGATSITVGTARLGGDLLRVSTPAGAGIRPDLVSGHAVRLFLDSTGTGGPAAVRVTLNSGVAWRLAFAGGSAQTSMFLGRGQLRGADFAAGSSQLTMRLPRPRGTVTIVLAGGASRVTVAAPAGVPARLSLDGGAGSTTLGGRSHSGVAGGTVLTAPGWSGAADRYDIQAPAGVARISVGAW
jgi:hypothetical protein